MIWNRIPTPNNAPADVVEQVTLEAKYSGYIHRQAEQPAVIVLRCRQMTVGVARDGNALFW